MKQKYHRKINFANYQKNSNSNARDVGASADCINGRRRSDDQRQVPSGSRRGQQAVVHGGQGPAVHGTVRAERQRERVQADGQVLQQVRFELYY